MANNAIKPADFANSIPEVWAQKALQQLKGYLNLARTVSRDYEDTVQRFGDTVNITVMPSLQANDKTPGTDVTRQTPTDTKKSVVLDNHKEVTFMPEDVARAFARPDIMAGLMTSAAVAISEAVEASIAEKYADATASVDAGSLSDPLASLREARRKLVTAKVPRNEPVYGYLSEFFVEQLPLTDASKLGVAAPVMDGSIAKLGGVNLFETQMVEVEGSPATYHNMVYVKDAIALVVRPLPLDAESFGGAKQTVLFDPDTGISIRVTMSYDANALAPQVTLDVLWGVETIRPEHLIDMTNTLS